jgi:pSer/pThr/pTyr-binding forkhead associated (FHA) protein
MLFCNRCGHRNPPRSAFCSSCGAELEQTISDETTASLPVVAGPDDEPGVTTPMLVVLRGPNAGSRFLLDQDLTRLGRHPEADILLDDVTVSRKHAEVVRRGEGFVVRDAGSLNGTYLNRRRVEEAALRPGDELQIGTFRLAFQGEGGAA